MKKLLSIFGAVAMLIALPAKAEFNYGVSVILGEVETSGSETEKTVSGVTSEVNTEEKSEQFLGGSLFAEYQLGNGIIFGVDYVPLDIELGSGERTDTAVATSQGGAENDSGTRKAEATVENLITIYTHIPVGPVYGILGYHDADITTSETLPTSSYGDASVNGIQYGVGVKGERMRLELSHSDFDDISLTSSANTNKISADADATSIKISYSF